MTENCIICGQAHAPGAPGTIDCTIDLFWLRLSAEAKIQSAIRPSLQAQSLWLMHKPVNLKPFIKGG